MPELKEKLPDDNEGGEKKKNILPLSLNTPDLTPRERQFLESASEKLAGEQIDRMFREDPNLQKAAEEFPPLRPGEKVPKEEEILQVARQKQTTEENMPAHPEDRKLIAFADEFRRMPSKFRLFGKWLKEAEKNYANQSAFQALPPEARQEISELEQLIHDIMSDGKNMIAPDNAAIIEMANAINRWIAMLSKLGVPNSALSRNAFTTWLNARNIGQGEMAGS